MHDDVGKFIRDRKIEEVSPSSETIQLLLEDASNHINSARALSISADLHGAFQLAYDSTRKCCAALLNHFGYRATNRGGHFAVFVCAGKLLEPIRQELDELQEVRRLRNAMEYPGESRLYLNNQDVANSIQLAVRVGTIVRTVIKFEE